tara:strand:- start:337 stop:498 length:162 start_codon:yes stop_codon:yes gene_type:complete
MASLLSGFSCYGMFSTLDSRIGLKRLAFGLEVIFLPMMSASSLGLIPVGDDNS